MRLDGSFFLILILMLEEKGIFRKIKGRIIMVVLFFPPSFLMKPLFLSSSSLHQSTQLLYLPLSFPFTTSILMPTKQTPQFGSISPRSPFRHLDVCAKHFSSHNAFHKLLQLTFVRIILAFYYCIKMNK